MNFISILTLQRPPLQGEVARIAGRRGITGSGEVTRFSVSSDAGIPLRRLRRHLPLKGREV